MSNQKLLILTKVYIFCFLVVFNSCERELPPPPEIEPPFTNSIVGYLDTPNAVLIKAFCLLSNDNTDGEAISSSEIKNGNFTLLLPDTLDDKFLYISGESDEYVEISCPEARCAYISYIEVYDSPRGAINNRIGQVFYGKYFEIINTLTEYYTHKVNIMFYYTDKDITVKGTRNNQGIVIDIFDVSLKRGWNKVYREEMLEINWEAGGTYTWTTIVTSTKSERYEGLEWYIWDGFL